MLHHLALRRPKPTAREAYSEEDQIVSVNPNAPSEDVVLEIGPLPRDLLWKPYRLFKRAR